MTIDFYRARLDQMIDLDHPLAVLGRQIAWVALAASLAPLFARPSGGAKSNKAIVGADLFGDEWVLAGVDRSGAGRPRLSMRRMLALCYLKHAYNLSDEALVEQWSQNVYYQYFSGNEYFEAKPPCDPTQLGRFRRILGEAGVEELLAKTIETAVKVKAIGHQELQSVIVDSTVQEKAIAHPNDSRLLELARRKVARLAKQAGLVLRQTYDKEGFALRRRAGGYAHARQFKRLHKVLGRQHTILGKLLRDIERKAQSLPTCAQERLQVWIQRAWRIANQKRNDKNKLYALHAPEAECISKGKSRNPYEFGVKVSLAVTHQKGLIVGARSFAGNPYDGHTLANQLEQTGILMQNLQISPKTVYTDLGYRGVDHELGAVNLIHRGKAKTLTHQQRQALKRRQAIEPTIGHLKADHRMNRNYLAGSEGDALNAVLAAVGFNIRWLLRALVRLKRAKFFLRLFLWAVLRKMRQQLESFIQPSGGLGVLMWR